MFFDVEKINREKAIRRTKGKVKCPKCDLFMCICELNLLDYVEVYVPINDDPARNCQKTCVHINSSECITCYNFHKFKGKVRLK